MVINKDITVIGFSFDAEGKKPSIKGITNYTGTAPHGIIIGKKENEAADPIRAEVRFQGVNLTEFGDSVGCTYYTYPIITSTAFEGMLDLNNVTIDKFNRTAVNACGGRVYMNNCTLTGCKTAKNTAGEYFQSGVETYNANVEINNCTITNMDSTYTDEDSNMAACIQVGNGNPEYHGHGSVRVNGGTYDGQYAIIVAADTYHDSNTESNLFIGDGEFNGKILYEQPISSESNKAITSILSSLGLAFINPFVKAKAHSKLSI